MRRLDSRWGANSEDFDPDRWLDGRVRQGEAIGPYANLYVYLKSRRGYSLKFFFAFSQWQAQLLRWPTRVWGIAVCIIPWTREFFFSRCQVVIGNSRRPKFTVPESWFQAGLFLLTWHTFNENTRDLSYIEYLYVNPKLIPDPPADIWQVMARIKVRVFTELCKRL